MEEMRLQKYLATSGIASRRKCEEMILDGQIKVNGLVITEVGTKINPEKDKLYVSIDMFGRETNAELDYNQVKEFDQ